MSRLKYVGALIAASAATAACVLPASAHATTGVPKDPILFVHGYGAYLVGGSPSNWDSFAGRLSQDGYDTANRSRRVSYGPVEPMALTAGNIALRVAELKNLTGASKIDIISHSYGGPSSRYYLKKLGGHPNVDEWVNLGGPNTGWKGAPCWAKVPFFGLQPTVLALTPGNACYDLNPNMPAMKYLNGGDQTPGSVRYLTIRTPNDEVVPNNWTPLSGDTRLVTTSTPAPNHAGLLSDPTVYAQVKDFLD